MSTPSSTLETIYAGYIAALNTCPLSSLAAFVSPTVVHNDVLLSLAGYEDLIAFHKAQVPDLQFAPTIILAQEDRLAVRLEFVDVTPVDGYLGYSNPDGKSVTFGEHAFYEFGQGKIKRVWSMVDEKAIERQLGE